MVMAMHDNSQRRPGVLDVLQVRLRGPAVGHRRSEVDEMIADATAATGEDRGQAWSELFGKLHDDMVADVLLFHMVGFSRVIGRLDFTPTIATNSELQLSQIKFK